MRPQAVVFALVTTFALSMAAGVAGQTTFYVAPDGNDSWSGRLPAPNVAGTDGPFATLVRARDAVRELKRTGRLRAPVNVQLRGGQYFITETVTFGPEDSGAASAPVTYCAYPGERPVLVGGRVVKGFRRRGKALVARLPQVAGGKWYFRSLFVDGRREIRAREPDFDPTDPYRKGFFYAQRDPQGFGLAVGNIHNRGDWLEYEVDIPADGQWFLWVYYGAQNAPFGRKTMDGRTAVKIDGGDFVPLVGLPDTGGWSVFKWTRCAKLKLTRGRHVMHWENRKGGGINLEAWVLTDDPSWQPRGTDLPKPAPGRHVVLIQAENFARSHGPQISVAGSGKGSRTSFTYAPGDLDPALAQAPDAEVHIFQSGSCRAFLEICKLVRVVPERRRVVVGGPECVAELKPGDRYWVENAPQLLDQPREWYLDRASGELYYIPPKDFSVERSQVIAPAVGRIIELIGDARGGRPVHHIRFVGLTFCCNDYSPDDGCVGYGMGTDGTVYIRAAESCQVRECTFVNIGKNAVCIVGGRNNVVADNDISHSAEGGVLLVGAVATRVMGNHIHHCGEVYKHVGGVVMTGRDCSENVVAGNVIHDISRYGITFKNAGLHNLVEGNFIQNTNLETYDTGGIEVTQHDRKLRSGSVIRGNIVADTVGYSCAGPDRPVFLSWGIYLDSFAGGYRVEGNLVYRSFSGGIMLQGGQGNTVTNNIFVDGWASQGYIANFRGNFADVVLERNIFAWSRPSALLFVHGAIRPDVIRIDYNLYWPGRKVEPRLRYGGPESWQAWQRRGFDEHSLIADPLFRDPGRENYSLRTDSPAYRLGLKPLDLSMAMAARQRCKCRIVPAAAIFFDKRPWPQR